MSGIFSMDNLTDDARRRITNNLIALPMKKPLEKLGCTIGAYGQIVFGPNADLGGVAKLLANHAFPRPTKKAVQECLNEQFSKLTDADYKHE